MQKKESGTEDSYAALTRNRAPHILIKKAIEIQMNHDGYALDLGAGALNEARALLAAGFTVDAVDRDPIILAIASEMQNRDLTVTALDIAEYQIAPNHYSLIVALNSLPFLSSALIKKVILGIQDGLTINGVLCITLLGHKDDWASRPDMSFFSKQEVLELFSDLQCMYFDEVEHDQSDVLHNKVKHWHIYRCIFRKIKP